MVKKRKLTELHGDERGAMMLISIFMAMITVGMLYYIAGVGETVVYRERMQDGADATTYMGAVIMARSMNIVVLVNLVMSSVFASAVITQLVIYIIWTAQGLADAACIASWGSCVPCCRAAACLLGDTCDAGDDHDDMVDLVKDAMDAGESVQDNLKSYSNELALAGSLEVASFFGAPVATGLSYGKNLPIGTDSRRNPMCNPETRGTGLFDARWQAIAIAAEARALYIACNTGKAYVLPAMVTAELAVSRACNSAHGDVDPRPARINGGTNLGSTDFQFWGGIIATSSEVPIDKHDTRLAIATWGRDGSGGLVDSLNLREAGRFAVAQSEYYHDAPHRYNGARDEWLWEMNWRARLRRFQVGGESGGTGTGVCGSVGPICSGLNSIINH